MKKFWKWVIGIVIGLVVVAALIGAAFLVRAHFVVNQVARLEAHGLHIQRPGMMLFGRGWGMRGPGMMAYGWRMPFGGLFGGLFSLGLLALVVVGIIWLVRSLRKPTHVVETPVVAPSAASTTHACPKCGRTVQNDWNNCPYCGKKL